MYLIAVLPQFFREKSYKESVELYQRAIFTQDPDDHGEFDATMADPNYLLLAKQADMYREGGFGLEKDPNRAGKAVLILLME